MCSPMMIMFRVGLGLQSIPQWVLGSKTPHSTPSTVGQQELAGNSFFRKSLEERLWAPRTGQTIT